MEERIWQALEGVHDPEIPPLSIVEMGLVRAVHVDGQAVEVVLTPTFSGCPALHVIRQAVLDAVHAAGFPQVSVRLQNDPPWTSDWITPEGREKLRQFGLAPPPRHNGLISAALLEVVHCPYCGSEDTELKNPFGPTLCRAIYVCHACRQPFEQFKPL